MGRKQKLREEKKRRIKDDPPSVAVTSTAKAISVTATAKAKVVSKAVSTALPTGVDHQDYLIYLDGEFPVSVEYAQVIANIKSIGKREIYE